MTPKLQLFEGRRDEAWQKLLELLHDSLDKADYIALDDNREASKRYSHLAQRGWPQFFNQEVRECPLCEGGLYYVMTWESRWLHFYCIECDAHIKLDIFKGMNHFPVYEVLEA